jgi:hypothetical protein
MRRRRQKADSPQSHRGKAKGRGRLEYENIRLLSVLVFSL